MKKYIHIPFLFIIMVFMSGGVFGLSAGSARAAMDRAEIEDMYGFLSFTKIYVRSCARVPNVRDGHFGYNDNFLRSQLKLLMLENNLDLTDDDAERYIFSISRESAKDANLMLEKFGCDGDDIDLFVDLYRDFSEMSPEDLGRLMLKPDDSGQDFSPAEKRYDSIFSVR